MIDFEKLLSMNNKSWKNTILSICNKKKKILFEDKMKIKFFIKYLFSLNSFICS